MRPVGSQSRFMTPTLSSLFPAPNLVKTVSELAMSHSFSIREVERRNFDRGPAIIKGDKLFDAACKLGLEGVVSKKLTSPYRSGPSRTWIKVKNPDAPAATRAIDGTF